jgi:hypothetical protein
VGWQTSWYDALPLPIVKFPEVNHEKDFCCICPRAFGGIRRRGRVSERSSFGIILPDHHWKDCPDEPDSSHRADDSFTPVQDGLFRMSVYMTQTAPTSSTDYWFFNANWTDDAGAELAHQACALPTTVTPPNAYVGEVGGNPGCVLVFRAKAGIPITYSTVEGFSGSGGAYSIYLALERLM